MAAKRKDFNEASSQPDWLKKKKKRPKSKSRTNKHFLSLLYKHTAVSFREKKCRNCTAHEMSIGAVQTSALVSREVS